MKKIVVITGPDGSGKSTLIKKWIQYTETHSMKKIQEVSIWDALLKEPVRSAFPLSLKQIDPYLSVLDTKARSLFLSHAIQQSIHLAEMQSSADIYVMNGYWMKYFACETAYGADESWLLSLSELFLKPEQVLYLDLPVQEALARKKQVSGYESGFALPERRNEQFEVFQKQVHRVLHRWKDRFHWNSIQTSGAPEATFEQSKRVLHDLFC